MVHRQIVTHQLRLFAGNLFPAVNCAIHFLDQGRDIGIDRAIPLKHVGAGVDFLKRLLIAEQPFAVAGGQEIDQFLAGHQIGAVKVAIITFKGGKIIALFIGVFDLHGRKHARGGNHQDHGNHDRKTGCQFGGDGKILKEIHDFSPY